MTFDPSALVTLPYVWSVGNAKLIELLPAPQISDSLFITGKEVGTTQVAVTNIETKETLSISVTVAQAANPSNAGH